VDLPPGDPLGRLLHQVIGLTRGRWMADPREPGNARPARRVVPGRPAPSAGGRYPIEVYAATTADPARPAGLYHYDPAHHALDPLRTGDAVAAVVACLAEAPPAPPALVLLLTTVLWRNSSKYGQFGYRLQTLDAGVTVAQVAAAGAAAGWHASTHLRFADDRLDTIVGCDADAEATLAVVALWPDRPATAGRPAAPPAPAWDGPPTRPVSAVVSVAGRPGFAELTALHRAARTAPAGRPGPAGPDAGEGDLPLPPARVPDQSAGMHRRRSVWGYHPSPVPAGQLDRLLAAAARAEPGDAGRVRLYCHALRVDGVPPGPYEYLPDRHRLRMPGVARPGDLSAAALDPGLRAEFRTAGLVVVPVGEFTDGPARHGDRWYRMQNILAGALANRVCLAAAALGLGSHVSCGFHPHLMDASLGLPAAGPPRSLVIITVGTARTDRRTLEVAL
jgi:SagB-type dehydrogenase family enzyme